MTKMLYVNYITIKLKKKHKETNQVLETVCHLKTIIVNRF